MASIAQKSWLYFYDYIYLIKLSILIVAYLMCDLLSDFYLTEQLIWTDRLLIKLTGRVLVLIEQTYQLELILICIHKSYIVYLENYAVPIRHGFSFFSHGKIIENFFLKEWPPC